MKTTCSILALVCFGVNALPAQVAPTKSAPAGATDGSLRYAEVERDAHSRVWARVSYETNALGAAIARTNSFVELQTGLHYREGDQWLASEAKIEILPNNAGAAAAKGPHKVIFPLEIKSGLIELQTADQQWLRSRVWGLSYFDSATGESVLIAEVKESEGQLVGDNTVIYPDAFTDCRATIRYTYTRAGFEQDVVLESQPPAPEKFGLSSKSVRLQVLTEFVATVSPTKENRQAGGLADQALRFGQMSIGSGKAFSVDAVGDATGEVPVAKEWTPLEGRDFLIEEVPYEAVAEQLQKLPADGEYKGASLHRRGTGANVIVGLKKHLPTRYAKAAPKPGTKRMAQVAPKTAPGFVMDYVLLTSQPNFIFSGNTTYYVSGTVNLSGTNTTFEGGTVIKYAPTNSAKLSVTSPITWRGSAYRPVVMTARDDSTVGESITTTNVLTGYYADIALDYDADTSSADATLSNLRIAYAKTAIYIFKKSGHVISHAQFVNCQRAINGSSSTISLRNALMYNVLTNFSGATIKAEHLTIDTANWLKPGATLSLTNSLLVNVTNPGSFTSNSVSTGTSAAFVTVGAGSHYLADNTYRNAGTASINTNLASDLKKLTTYPPLELTNNFTVATTLSPQAGRDTDTLDLGYHYDPLDYVVSGRTLTNATLTLTNGVALGTYGTSSSYGIYIRKGGNLVSEGSPANLNQIVRYNTSQEQANTNWSATTVAHSVKVSADGTTKPTGSFRFTGWSLLGGRGYHFHAEYSSITTPFGFKDCQFGPGSLYAVQSSVALTNCLLERPNLNLDDDGGNFGYYGYNNLFRLGSVTLARNGSTTWIFKDNLFDRSTISATSSITHSNNAYVSGSNRLSPNNANDVVLTNAPIYLTSYLGKYYYPTDDGMLGLLINAGSRTAPGATLYHFATTTDQTKEADSQVDIGFHYVAVDGDGNPVDSDEDGTPDYREDANGNGTVDSGETDWNSATDLGLRVIITEPKQSANLP